MQTQRSAVEGRSDKGLSGQPSSLAGPSDQFTSLEDLTERFERARGGRPAVQNPNQHNQQLGPSSGHEGLELFRKNSLTNHSESTPAVMVEVDRLQKQVARIDQVPLPPCPADYDPSPLPSHSYYTPPIMGYNRYILRVGICQRMPAMSRDGPSRRQSVCCSWQISGLTIIGNCA